MLRRLSIRNFLLIQNLELNFDSGFTVITGETGAGKSIMLGALHLLLGARAESKLVPKTGKTILEAVFTDYGANVDEWLMQRNFDIMPELILHRELLPGGRGRCFINDTPAQVTDLRELGTLMVDIHAQMEHRELNLVAYRNRILDAFCGSGILFAQYKALFEKYKTVDRDLEAARSEFRVANANEDYRKFLIDEFEKLSLLPEKDAMIEQELKMAEHADKIIETIAQSIEVISDGPDSLLQKVVYLQKRFAAVAAFSERFGVFQQRLSSIEIELRDILFEVNGFNEAEISDTSKLESLRERWNTINTLFFKHKVTNVEELVAVEERLRKEDGDLIKLEETVDRLRIELDEASAAVRKVAGQLTKVRTSKLADFNKAVNSILGELGMKHAVLKADIATLSEPGPWGLEHIHFMFSANKGLTPMPLEKVASGGEYSRIVLAIKTLTHSEDRAPVVVFDEIDTGVSGEIADKMARLMLQLSSNVQVLSITHLPQVAARGNHHFKVSKQHLNDRSITQIVNISGEERIIELATMLSGNKLTDAARENARILLDN
jgi:DNA repair protein RecN (Recombination protein N)